MYHSLTGKPSLRVVLVMGLLIGLCSLLLLAACGGQESAKGAAGQEHKKSTSESTSGGTASTDGLIVFRRYLDLEGTKSAIFTMHPNGSHVRQITHPPKGFSDDSPAWSPDGTKVAFHRQATDESTSRIMVLNTKTGDARQVVTAMEGSDPAFSPDGKMLAFKRSSGIWVVWSLDGSGSLDGSAAHQVTNIQKRGALEFEDSGPAFSPGGTMLVFERTRLEDDNTAVFVQPIDWSSTGSPEDSRQDARQITPWKMSCGDGPEFSPKGDWVLFRCDDEGRYSDLYWVHPNGTGLERLTNAPHAPDQPDDVDYVGSSFSPEFDDEAWGYTAGNIVAARYPAYGDEGNSDVFGMHIDHGVQGTVNLTKSNTLDDDPSWGTYPPSARQ
jgi:Tol biopolymer transport system component